ncbi:MAG TPA: mechanosensitive ion channel family protein [Trueperaceae bacterium]|nr:mechanosensitive ion channel family protein [Trueperaceae bacterium]
MSGAAGFAAGVWSQLRESLLKGLGPFGPAGVASGSALTTVATKLIVALLLLIVFAAVYSVLSRLLAGIGQRLRLPRDLLRLLRRALAYAVSLLALLAVLAQFGVDGAALGRVATAALFALVYYAAWLVAHRLLANATSRAGLDRSLVQLLRNVVGVVIGALAVVTVLDQFGVDVLGVVTALGVVGIAVGFAAQDTLGNFISGVTLLIERPFHIGDWVELAGEVGRVERISLRTTRVVSRDNVHSSIPNAKVASAEIVNLSAGGPLRLRVPVGIAYKESARAARNVLMPLLESHPEVLQEPGRRPSVLVKELGSSSVDLLMLAWIGPEAIADAPAVSASLLEGAKEALDDAGIQIPFPHLQLFIDEARGLEPVVDRLRG